MFLDQLPQEQKKQVLVERKIKQVYEQFSACVDPFIADHVNSVYLIKEPSDVSRETLLKLTVYVDNSMVAAELNAQRELVILKYRELFSLDIKEMIIKISRGAYLDNYPLRALKEEEPEKTIHQLTDEEIKEIEDKTAEIKDPELRKSFQSLLKATKEHPLNN